MPRHKVDYIPAEFWLRIKVGQSNECWPWDSPSKPQMRWKGKTRNASRIAAHLEGILPNLDIQRTVGHKCKNRRCCNPAHLYLA
jgi:hypothetical protein